MRIRERAIRFYQALRAVRVVRKAVFIAAAAAAAIFLFTVFAVLSAASGSTYYSASEVPKNAVALVFWTSKYVASGLPNAYFESRTDAAAQLYREGRVDCLIVSGDNATLSYNETRDLQLSLMEKGVPPERIIPDYAGFRTLDSVVRANKVFGQSRLTLVTQKGQALRALFLAKHSDIEAVAFVSRSPEWSLSTLYVGIRELWAWIVSAHDLFYAFASPKFLGDPIRIETDPTIRPVPEKICFPR